MNAAVCDATVNEGVLVKYALNKRLLVSYQNDAGQRTVGIYAKSRTGNDTYLSIDPSQSISVVLLADKSIPDNPVPSSIITSYEGKIPETPQAQPFSRGRQFGIRVIAPVYRRETLAGVLVGEIVYTQDIMKRYASLSKTGVNLFAGDQFSIGTLAAQTSLSPHVGEQIVRCEEVLNRNIAIPIVPLMFDHQNYYQGQRVFYDDRGTFIGGMSVSLSQEIEQHSIRKILTAVFGISIIGVLIAVLLVSGVLVPFFRSYTQTDRSLFEYG